MGFGVIFLWKKDRKVLFGWFGHRKMGWRGGGDTKHPGTGDPNWDGWELPVLKTSFKSSDLNQNLNLRILGSSKLGPFNEFQVPPKPLGALPQQAGDKDMSLSPFPPEQEQLCLLSQNQNPPNYRVLGLCFCTATFISPLTVTGQRTRTAAGGRAHGERARSHLEHRTPQAPQPRFGVTPNIHIPLL